jgi:hypothetical protein
MRVPREDPVSIDERFVETRSRGLGRDVLQFGEQPVLQAVRPDSQPRRQTSLDAPGVPASDDDRCRIEPRRRSSGSSDRRTEDAEAL